MAYIVMAILGMAYIDTADIVTAYTVMANVGMAYVGM